MIELSNKDLMPIFLAHYGAEFVYAGSIGTIRKMAGINRRYMIEEEAPTGDTFRIELCQLLLTSLDKISDEDAVEVYKMVFSPVGGTKDILVRNVGGIIHLYSKYADDGLLSNGWMGIYSETLEIIYRDDNRLENPDTYRALMMFDYLRSKGYNCGYASYSPQDLVSMNVVKIK